MDSDSDKEDTDNMDEDSAEEEPKDPSDGQGGNTYKAKTEGGKPWQR